MICALLIMLFYQLGLVAADRATSGRIRSEKGMFNTFLLLLLVFIVTGWLRSNSIASAQDYYYSHPTQESLDNYHQLLLSSSGEGVFYTYLVVFCSLFGLVNIVFSFLFGRKYYEMIIYAGVMVSIVLFSFLFLRNYALGPILIG